jgi:hypothetical protein
MRRWVSVCSGSFLHSVCQNSKLPDEEIVMEYCENRSRVKYKSSSKNWFSEFSQESKMKRNWKDRMIEENGFPELPEASFKETPKILDRNLFENISFVQKLGLFLFARIGSEKEKKSIFREPVSYHCILS